MGLLFRVLYAVHARGTHHKLALDGLSRLQGPDAERWQRLLLKNAEPFMVGAKAPDDEFKDFKNHVLHVRDGYWGGAPETARAWYDKLVRSLESRSWADVAYNAGVLSHYVTDPIHPFHTGQTEAENAIHRAFEWSTAKSYDVLKAAASAPLPTLTPADREDWLEEMLRQGATASNRHYEKLIAHYDIHRGVVDPPAGLDAIAQRILGELIGYASQLFSVVLQRAIADSRATPDDVSLTLDAILATLQIPLKKLLNKLADKADQREVERIYDELRATGTVEQTLREDDRVVRELHRIEVLGGQAIKPATAEARPKVTADVVKPSRQPAPASMAAPVPRVSATSSVPIVAPRSVEPESEALPARVHHEMPAAPVSLINSATSPGTNSEPIPARTDSARLVDLAAAAGAVAAKAAEAAARAPSVTPLEPRVAARNRGPRLALGDDVVDAPSIGPRMAERLRAVGIATVQDLVQTRADRISENLGQPAVTPETVVAWQHQARLVTVVPGLTGTGAQLLVGAGYIKVDQIAAAEPEKLCADVLAYAGTMPGQRILRDGEPPNIERIKTWADGARQALAA